jgi:hypothetical protein
MSELENSARDEAAIEDVPGQVTELGKISELLGRDAPAIADPDDDDGADEAAAAPDPDPVETPEADPDPDLAADDADDSEPAKIDYDQVVPMPDGAEPVTVGQLKDHYQGRADFDQERTAWEDARMLQENKTMAARQQLYDLANLVGEVNPAVLEHMQNMRSSNQQQEQAALLGVFPEWVDPAVKKAAAPALIATIAEYGYSQADFAHIQDHRQIKVISDLARYKAREKAGLEKAEQLKPVLPKGQKSAQRKQTSAQKRADSIKRAKSGNEGQKLTAIGDLIKRG